MDKLHGRVLFVSLSLYCYRLLLTFSTYWCWVRKKRAGQEISCPATRKKNSPSRWRENNSFKKSSRRSWSRYSSIGILLLSGENGSVSRIDRVIPFQTNICYTKSPRFRRFNDWRWKNAPLTIVSFHLRGTRRGDCKYTVNKWGIGMSVLKTPPPHHHVRPIRKPNQLEK